MGMTLTEQSTSAGGEHPPHDRKRSRRRFARDLLILFVIAVVVSFLVKTFVVRSFYIPSGSMSHTLEVDDRIIVNELVPDLVALERGDVVVFRDPGGWLGPHVEQPAQAPLAAAFEGFLALIGLDATDSDDHLVKRVIGLPGDHVVCCNGLGQMSVNDIPLREPYVMLAPGDTKVSSVSFDVVVPPDSLWVMGDNRDNSQDSRFQTSTPSRGFVPMRDVVGRAFVVSWPLSRWAWLGNYPEVFDGVEQREH